MNKLYKVKVFTAEYDVIINNDKIEVYQWHTDDLGNKYRLAAKQNANLAIEEALLISSKMEAVPSEEDLALQVN